MEIREIQDVRKIQEIWEIQERCKFWEIWEIQDIRNFWEILEVGKFWEIWDIQDIWEIKRSERSGRLGRYGRYGRSRRYRRYRIHIWGKWPFEIICNYSIPLLKPNYHLFHNCSFYGFLFEHIFDELFSYPWLKVYNNSKPHFLYIPEVVQYHRHSIY